ncbi:MAG: tRNA (adenosine(37)-N6)-threonylcarbamoyltransferase complex ATPase subunit type 1 TsaE [Spirochaetes bacterium]|nr:tRNA (adenosine(37)-N6)-threonylcarbamoyltransferase complex ATPase subunit type 1 TsaE [Spirochaetota bacterium]
MASETVHRSDIGAFARRFAETIQPGDIHLLIGPLGAGKTTFVREIARVLDADAMVSSPTFTIVNEYDIALRGERMPLRHVDLYRLEGVDAVHTIGLMDMLADRGVSFIEWGERLKPLVSSYIEITIDIVSDDARRFTVERH